MIINRKQLNKAIKRLSVGLRRSTGLYKPKILLIAPVEHHSIHLEPLIDKILQSKAIAVTVIGPFLNRIGVDTISDIESIKIYNTYDLIVTTDFELIPWWLNGKTLFFGHGVGPKLNYQTNHQINTFDYIFCPCKPIYDSQKNSDGLVYRIGLPILDSLVRMLELSERSSDQKIKIVYAPSWSKNISVVSNFNLILPKLEQLSTEYEVVVSPHPNLFNPIKCSGLSFFDKTNLEVNFQNSGKSTISLCMEADIVISDISSVLFEALALGKTVFFDGNLRIYEYSNALSYCKEMIKHVPTIDWEADLSTQLMKKHPDPTEYINDYIYNIGNATNIFNDTILDLLKKENVL